LSQPIIDPFVHFGRLASGEGFHLHHVALLRIARYPPPAQVFGRSKSGSEKC
jgi:hypothetical protein